MSSFESLKELLKNLVFGSLSRENIGMLVSFVDTSDIIDVNPAITILIKLFVSLSNHFLSGHVHWSSNGSYEFIIGY